MKRLSFLAALFGLQAAAQTEFPPLHGAPTWEYGKATNRQCPVCGAMAEALKHEPLTVSVNVTRCKRCNAAFFQDPEVRP